MKKKALLLGMMSLFLVGGVSTALALTYQPGTTSVSGKADQAIYLTFNNEVAIDNITNLKVNDPQFRDVILDSKESSTYASTGVDVTFTLASIETSVLDGLTVEVFGKASAFSNENQTNDGTSLFTLSKTQDTQTDTVIFAGEGVKAATKYYRLKINYDGAMPTADAVSKTISGKVTVALKENGK